VRNSNRVTVVRLDSQLAAGTALGNITDPGLDVPTTATVAAGRLWAVNGPVRYGADRLTRSIGSLNYRFAQKTAEAQAAINQTASV
jgi:hypothetical protein